MTDTDKLTEYIEAQNEGFAEGRVKVHITLDESYGMGGETVWATFADSQKGAPEGHALLVIDNVPFYADQFTFGSTVIAKDPPEGRAYFEWVSTPEWGDRVGFWLGLSSPDRFDDLAKMLDLGEGVASERASDALVVASIAKVHVPKFVEALDAEGSPVEEWAWTDPEAES